MSKIIPFESNYNTIRKFESTAFYFLLLSALTIGALWLFPKLNLETSIKSFLSPFKEYIKPLSYVSMIGYLVLSMIAKFLFKDGEKTKRDDLIDNSFGTSYSDENSSEYYNNEEMPLGIKKLAINSYESSFHTENTLKKMLYKKSLRVMLLTIPFLLSIFTSGGENIVRLLFEISIPIIMISQLITTFGFYDSVKRINERFKVELMNIGKSTLEIKNYPKLLIPVMEYYNIKSWASINLDEKIFKKYNDEISKKWLKRKGKLNI